MSGSFVPPSFIKVRACKVTWSDVTVVLSGTYIINASIIECVPRKFQCQKVPMDLRDECKDKFNFQEVRVGF